MDVPITQYAKSGKINLAYQIVGNGEDYLVLIPGWVSNIEEVWNIPQLAAWLWYLASLNTLVIFDKRGTGLSDPVNENDLPNTSQRADDLRIILADIGVKRANLIGLSEGGPLAVYLAANYPDMVNKMILIGSFSKWIKTDDYPYGLTREHHNMTKAHIFEHWGKPVGLNLMAPSVMGDREAQDQWSTFLRKSASPNTAKMFYQMNMDIDVRDLLEKVAVPTLIMHRIGDTLIDCNHSRFIEQGIPGSQLLMTEGKDHLPWFSVRNEELTAIQTFLSDGKAVAHPKLENLQVKDIFALYRVRAHLLKNFDQQLSLESLSRKFGINQYKLKSGFRMLFDSPVIRFLWDVRLQNACNLLGRPEETVASIAEKVGYGHANNFSAAFKRKYGLKPLQYRTKIYNM
ncbi:MAG TPA: alpha/beta fold hydrolase [Eudoraea sp.]|nr:alpha/beta fold hydrolase [Eudoraea sp.]